MKRAFTLIEVIFVLIILGVLASIGSEIIANVYQNYLLSRSVANTSYKLDVALMQIAARLSHRVPNTVVVRDANGTLNTLQQPGSSAYNHIEWIASAYEARRGEYNSSLNYYKPGWSGLADLEASDKSTLVTPGSTLSAAKRIINDIYGVDLSAANNGCALIFRGQFEQDPIQAYGWDGSTPNAVYTVYEYNDTAFKFDNTAAKKVTDIYDLACSAFAIKHTSDDKLLLYFGYRPWLGEEYNSSNASSITLLEHVTAFQIRSRPVNVNNQFVQGSIEIRICIEDNTTGTAVEFCGQKVVF